MCKSEEGKGKIECTYMSKHKREGKKLKKSASVWVSKTEERKSVRVRVHKCARVRREKVKSNARI
jgi:hypothetical protein